MSNHDYDFTKVRVTVNGIVIDSVTAEYEADFNEGRAYWFGKSSLITPLLGVPPKTLRERGWKWPR